jgi:glycosyltransferase involved in cell wall biosynthesis
MPPTEQGICLIGDIDPPLGGVATYCRNLSEQLSRQGWPISLVDTSGGSGKRLPAGLACYTSASARASLLYAMDSRSRRARRSVAELVGDLSFRDRIRMAALSGRIIRVLEQFPVTLVHSNHAGLRSLAALAAAETAGLPLVITIHGAGFTSPALVRYRPLAVKLCHRAAALLANSSFTANAAHEAGVRSAISVTHLGVDTDRFSPGPVAAEFFQRYQLNREKRRVLFAGWLSPNKGVDVLLDAVSRLDPDLRRNLECLCVGPEKGLLRELRERAARETVASIRILTDIPQADLPVFYRAADIFVLPTRTYEGFGLVALEALASGCAVIGSNLGGIPEAMNGAGVLFEPGNAAELAGALDRLLRSGEDLNRLRSAGPIAARQLSWKETATRTVAVYQAVLGGT